MSEIEQFQLLDAGKSGVAQQRERGRPLQRHVFARQLQAVLFQLQRLDHVGMQPVQDVCVGCADAGIKFLSARGPAAAIRFLEALWGEGYLSPGGLEEVACSTGCRSGARAF